MGNNHARSWLKGHSNQHYYGSGNYFSWQQGKKQRDSYSSGSGHSPVYHDTGVIAGLFRAIGWVISLPFRPSRWLVALRGAAHLATLLMVLRASGIAMDVSQTMSNPDVTAADLASSGTESGIAFVIVALLLCWLGLKLARRSYVLGTGLGLLLPAIVVWQAFALNSDVLRNRFDEQTVFLLLAGATGYALNTAVQFLRQTEQEKQAHQAAAR